MYQKVSNTNDLEVARVYFTFLNLKISERIVYNTDDQK